jgi:hypothetical protein
MYFVCTSIHSRRQYKFRVYFAFAFNRLYTESFARAATSRRDGEEEQRAYGLHPPGEHLREA